MKNLSEALEPMQEKNAIFAVGRFQPCTAGHYKVFNKMKLFIREHSELKLTPIIVIVEGVVSSEDKKKNPLTGEERIKFMKASGKVDGFKFILAKNSFIAPGLIRQLGFEPIVVAAGSDRAEGYIKNLDKSFRDEAGEEIKHYTVPGLDRLESAVATKKTEKSKALEDALSKMSSEELSDDEISGSLARHAAELGYLDEFTEIVGLKNKPALAKIMFNKIRKAIGAE